MSRTIQEIAATMAEKYDLVPAAALSMSRVFLGQAADVEGVEADPDAVTDSQAEAIEHELSQTDDLTFAQDWNRVEEAAGAARHWVENSDVSPEYMLADPDLMKALKHAADDALSVGDLAEASGLEREQILDMLEER